MQLEESILIDKIPDGFKQTEVGVIPKDWEVKRLGEFSNITKLAGFEYSKYFNSYKDGGDIIVLRGTNITNNELDLNDVKRIPARTSKKLMRSKLFKGDLVFAYVGTIGPVYLVAEDDKFHLGPNTSKISTDKEIDARYIFSYFKSWLIGGEIFLHTSIGAQPSLSMSKIRKFRIILPPTLAEQTAIANALSDMDALIEAQEALLAKKRAIKQGAMQELLTGKRRLVETDGTSWQQTEVGRVPGDWEVKTLDALARLIIDGTHHTPVYKERGIPFLRVTDIRRRTIDYSNLKFISEEEHQNLIKRCHPERGDLLLSKNGTIGIPKVVKWDWPFSVFVSLCLIKLKPSKLDVHLLEQFFQSEIFNLQLKQLSKQGTVTNLHLEDIRKLKFPLPPTRHEQTAIANALSDMDAEIEQLEAQLAKYRQLKQGMMQELLTGRKRLI